MTSAVVAELPTAFCSPCSRYLLVAAPRLCAASHNPPTVIDAITTPARGCGQRPEPQLESVWRTRTRSPVQGFGGLAASADNAIMG
jgi:hypothetical protein